MPPGKAQLERNPPTIGTNPSNQMVIWAELKWFQKNLYHENNVLYAIFYF